MVALWLYVVSTVVVAVVLVQQLVVTRVPARRQHRLERLARRAALPAAPASAGGDLPDDLVERLRARVVARDLAGLAGGLAGLVLTTVLLALGPELGRRGAELEVGAAGGGFALDVSMLPVAGVLLVLLGQQVGVLLVAGRQALARPDGGGPRVARATAPVLADYVPRLETTLVRLVSLVPLLAALVVGAAWLALPAGPRSGEGAVLAVAALAALLQVGVELLCRRVLDQPQPARSAVELAWDDVLRARLLRDLVPVPLLLGAFAGGLLAVAALPPVVAALGLSDGRAVAAVAFGVMLLVLAVALVLLVSVVSRSAEQHVRRRLWSTPAAPAGPGAEVAR
ncbi:hypothetical protein [Pseudokineococcus sp. 1T1Z-3]|uniref:hypothetical protein n=1 Tax=Pseudokineococcus sp. 1T1Z-3 TaxID=3132745 RepID=UPI0030A7DA22